MRPIIAAGVLALLGASGGARPTSARSRRDRRRLSGRQQFPWGYALIENGRPAPMICLD